MKKRDFGMLSRFYGGGVADLGDWATRRADSGRTTNMKCVLKVQM